MKNLSLILNGVLAVAVVVLYVLHFSGPSEEAEVPQGEETTEEVLGPLTIAYVNSDSLLSNYELFKEYQEILSKRRTDVESQIQTRVRGLESEIASFQRTVNSMTIGQARAVEEDLQKKQQNLIQYRDQLSQSILIEENNYNNEIYDKMTEYLEKYCDENNYHMVLGYQRGGGVLYANQGLEITNEVVKGLNEDYNKSQAEEQAAQDSIQ